MTVIVEISSPFDSKQIGNIAKMMRGHLNVTQEVLAQITGVNQTRINHIENGALVQFDQFSKIAEYLEQDNACPDLIPA